MGYRHALPPPLGVGNDCRNGRSLSTAGASEEREARAGWGLQMYECKVETREGGCPPFKERSLLVLLPFGQSHSRESMMYR